MTVTLDLAPHLFDQVEAAARAQNRPVADLLNEAIADRYDPEDADMSGLPPLPPSLRQSLADDLREGFADIDAGRVVDGETFFAELREYTRNGQNK